MSNTISSVLFLNTNAKSFIPSNETLEKIQIENKLKQIDRDIKEMNCKIETVYFNKKETEWWEYNKAWLSMD